MSGLSREIMYDIEDSPGRIKEWDEPAYLPPVRSCGRHFSVDMTECQTCGLICNEGDQVCLCGRPVFHYTLTLMDGVQ